jgi:predicted secreted hydrolase
MKKRHAPGRSLRLYTAAMILLAAACCAKEQPLKFPFDHGPHFKSDNEWWYFSGVVADSDGSVLGFECTIFKRLIVANQFGYVGHVAVSDPTMKTYAYDETINKHPAPGIAEGIPKIEIDNFSYDYSDNKTIFIQGTSDNASVDLALIPLDDVLPHGDSGAIAMGDGLRSYYYSITNLETTGTITFNGRMYGIVSGRTWMDHQWGNFTPFALLWDWFSLRFDDGGALMLFRFRDLSGREVSTNFTYRTAAGAVTYGSSCIIEAGRIYADPTSACRCPLDWTVTIPDLHATFSIEPLFDSQIFFSKITPDYWEGISSYSGSINGSAVKGAAYVELSGYCNLLAPNGDK